MGESVFVDTLCGRLRGLIISSTEGYDYCAFKGIPYAKPPVGELRFKEPVPAEPWSGVRDATEFGPICAQYDFVSKSIKGSDDCLYLNVYVRSIRPENRLPVMVWVHGGAFMYGSADDVLYGPDYLLKKDIVLVTFNYRMGVLGFLNFDDEVAPGNQGIKDAIVVLKWVQKNIANFGGDVNNVTLFGESAGGSLAHILALSNLTEGLFHKVIVQSGVATCTWVYAPNRSSAAYKIAEVLGGKSKDPKELIKLLRTVDCNELIKAQQTIRSYEDKLQCTFPFGPGIDLKSKTPIIPIKPSELIKKGVQLPIIIGCNDREGIFNLPGMNELKYEKMDKKFEDYLNDAAKEIMKQYNITAEGLKRMYFGSERICKKNVEKFVDLYTDVPFIEGIHRTIRAQVEKSSTSTYFYRFTYDKNFSLTKSMANTTMSGASHFDEVQYLFKMQMFETLNLEQLPSSSSYRLMEQMVEMWYNFAKYGRPTPIINDLITTYWLPVTNEKIFRTLNINEDLRMESIVNLEERFHHGLHMKNKL